MDETLSFFGLREQPFAPTADPAFFFATREHKECLFRLWNSVDNRHGIAVVLGNYGTGKTTLLRKMMTGMAADRDRYLTAVIGSPIPSWTSFALLESIIIQFGIPRPKPSFVDYMEALNQFLLVNRNKICTLIIDDSQNLNKRGQLELLRLAQNLETPQHKLLNLVFFAQLEWMHVLRAAPNFEQRINMTYTLEAIDVAEMRGFIEFRLRQAGATPQGGPFFDDVAVKVIHAYSEGSPRLSVTLCRNAMLLAARLQKRVIDRDMILHTIEKTTVPDPEKRAKALAAANTGQPVAQSFAEAPVRPSPRREIVSGNQTRQVMSRDERASLLLNRAARNRQGQRNP